MKDLLKGDLTDPDSFCVHFLAAVTQHKQAGPQQQAADMAQDTELRVGQTVDIHRLSSSLGMPHNGKHGCIVHPGEHCAWIPSQPGSCAWVESCLWGWSQSLPYRVKWARLKSRNLIHIISSKWVGLLSRNLTHWTMNWVDLKLTGFIKSWDVLNVSNWGRTQAMTDRRVLLSNKKIVLQPEIWKC